MTDLLEGYVESGEFVTFLVMLALVAFFIYKEYPEFKKRVMHRSTKAIYSDINHEKVTSSLEGVQGRLEELEATLDEMNKKLERDYYRLNTLEEDQRMDKKIQKETLEENEVIMRALLGMIGGLQELGANGPTREAEREIKDYLNRKAHSA